MSNTTTQPGTIRTAGETSIMHGMVAEISMGFCRFDVRILDTRQRWGRTDALVTPLAGSGDQWVDAARLVNVRFP